MKDSFSRDCSTHNTVTDCDWVSRNFQVYCILTVAVCRKITKSVRQVLYPTSV